MTDAAAALLQPDPCPYCHQPTGQDCVTLVARVPTKPHGKRLALGRVYAAGAASRQPEIDAVTEKADEKADTLRERETEIVDLGVKLAAAAQLQVEMAADLAASKDALTDLQRAYLSMTKALDAAYKERDALKAQLEALTPTVFGMSLSPGDSFTKPGAKETAAQQATRIKATYGALTAAKCFYQGALPATFNTAYEGLVATAAVCFKPSQDALAAGSLDAAIKGYLDTIPAGHKVLLVNHQEPDDEIWVDHVFTAAQHRAATQRLCDIVHNHPAGQDGRAEVWDVWMGFSLDSGRWTDAAACPDVDGIGWDYYWNRAENRVGDPKPKLKMMADKTKALGIGAWGLFETGDNPDPTDPTGSKRAGHWTRVYDAAAALRYSYVLYFNAIGTTGDHRLIPGQAYSDPTIKMVAARMKG